MKTSAASSPGRGASPQPALLQAQNDHVSQQVQHLESSFSEFQDQLASFQVQCGIASINSQRTQKHIDSKHLTLETAIQRMSQELTSIQAQIEIIVKKYSAKEEIVLTLVDQSSQLKDMLSSESQKYSEFRGKLKTAIDIYNKRIQKCIKQQQDITKQIEEIEAENTEIKLLQEGIMEVLSQLEGSDHRHESDLQEVQRLFHSLQHQFNAPESSVNIITSKTDALEMALKQELKPKLDNLEQMLLKLSNSERMEELNNSLLQDVESRFHNVNRKIESLQLEQWYGDSLKVGHDSEMDEIDGALLHEIKQFQLSVRIPIRKLSRGMYSLFGERVRILVEKGECMVIFMNEGMASFKSVVSSRIGPEGRCSEDNWNRTDVNISRISPLSAHIASPRDRQQDHSTSNEATLTTPRNGRTAFSAESSPKDIDISDNGPQANQSPSRAEQQSLTTRHAITIPNLQLARINYDSINSSHGHTTSLQPRSGGSNPRALSARSQKPNRLHSTDQPLSARLLRPTISSSRKTRPASKHSKNTSGGTIQVQLLTPRTTSASLTDSKVEKKTSSIANTHAIEDNGTDVNNGNSRPVSSRSKPVRLSIDLMSEMTI